MGVLLGCGVTGLSKSRVLAGETMISMTTTKLDWMNGGKVHCERSNGCNYNAIPACFDDNQSSTIRAYGLIRTLFTHYYRRTSLHKEHDHE
jgi:hypothetical protein